MSGPAWAGAVTPASLRPATARRGTRALLIALLAAALATPATAMGQEFGISSPSFPDANEVRCPGGITAGPDGALWFVEEATSRIGRMTPGGVVTHEFPVPLATASALPCSDPGFVGALDQITVGPDGALWFTQPRDNQIGQITTAGTVTEFTLPGGTFPNGRPEGITAGPDGALWFTAANIGKIGRIASAPPYAISAFPPGAGTAGAGLSDITSGPDGRLWFTAQLGNQIGAIDPSTGLISAHSAGLTPASEPSGITVGPGGGLWFTESAANQIGQITTSGVITEYPGTGAGPSAIAVGRDGALWFTESEANSIGRITTGGVITNHFPIGTPGGEPSDITAGPDGALWFTEFAGNKIGRIETAPPVTTLPQLPPVKPLLPKKKPKRCKVPKLKNLTVKQAKKKLRKAKCRYRLSGKGRVVSSSPKAGKRTSKKVRVKAKPKPRARRRK